MKIRWTSGSLRIRISPTELATLERREPLEERLRIPGAILGSSWTVLVLPGSGRSEISSSGNVVLLDLNHIDVAKLADSTAEGVYFQRSSSGGEGEGFSFYIEKDFPCVHPRASEVSEPESETFAPPVGFEERKL